MPAALGAWVVDLDGVIWLSGEPIPGADRAVRALRLAGTRVLFATNNSALTIGSLRERLGRAGIEADPADLVTSARAAATLVEPGATVLVVAGAGVHEALAARRVTVVEQGPADAVVVGWTDRFDFARLSEASRAVRAGALLIGTNDDPTFPTPDGLIPGAGSLLAAVATAGGTAPIVAGKPNPPMTALIRREAPVISLVVGDRPSTDGRLAEALGVPFGLVLSGVTPQGAAVPDPGPSRTASNFLEMVEDVLRSPGGPPRTLAGN